jgi:hypothetical protein
MRVLEVAVQDITSIKTYYDNLRIYRASTYAGSYTLLQTVPLVTGQTLYSLVDNDGLTSDCYRFTYYKSTVTTAESSQLDLPVYYCTVANLKARLGETGLTDDAQFVDAVAAATGSVKRYCNREFKQVVETRYFEGPTFKGQYSGREPQLMYVDDLVAATVLQLDYSGGRLGAQLTTLTIGTDVYLWPQDASNLDEPYNSLAFVPGSNYQIAQIQSGNYRDYSAGFYWPRGYQAVRVTGTWGWPVNPVSQSPIPPAVREATLQIAARIYKGRDNAYSRVIGAAGIGTMSIADDLLNKDTRMMLETYRRKHRDY